MKSKKRRRAIYVADQDQFLTKYSDLTLAELVEKIKAGEIPEVEWRKLSRGSYRRKRKSQSGNVQATDPDTIIKSHGRKISFCLDLE